MDVFFFVWSKHEGSWTMSCLLWPQILVVREVLLAIGDVEKVEL